MMHNHCTRQQGTNFFRFSDKALSINANLDMGGVSFGVHEGQTSNMSRCHCVLTHPRWDTPVFDTFSTLIHCVFDTLSICYIKYLLCQVFVIFATSYICCIVYLLNCPFKRSLILFCCNHGLSCKMDTWILGRRAVGKFLMWSEDT